MDVIDALNTRRSTRAFLPAPVDHDKLAAVLDAAGRTPSWANTQPWEVFVATGGTLEKIRAAFLAAHAQKAPSVLETPRPAHWPEVHRARMRQLGPDMTRDCSEAYGQFAALNQALFHAPAVIYLCLDKTLTEWSLYDLGAYAQSIMLAACDFGLATITAVNLVLYPEVLRQALPISDDLNIAVGIAIGYADTAHGINRFCSDRRPFAETVRFCG